MDIGGFILAVVASFIGGGLAGYFLKTVSIKKTVTQKGEAKNKGIVKQAGRDMQDIRQTTVIQERASPKELFLSRGETVLDYREGFTDFVEDVNQAKQYVKIKTITGAAWLLKEDVKEAIRKAIQERGVKVSLLLQNPHCEAAQDEKRVEYDLAEGPLEDFVRPNEQLEKNVKATLDIYVGIIGRQNIRISDEPFVWKGSIIDGIEAHSIFYDIPRRGAPLRETKNKVAVQYIDKYYFDKVYERGVEP